MYRSEAEVWVPLEVGTVWSYLADDQNYPRFIGHLVATERLGDQTSRWYLRTHDNTPLMLQVSLLPSPARELSWRSLPGQASLETEGQICLEPDGQGTRIRLCYAYRPLSEPVRGVFARLFADAGAMAGRDLEALRASLTEPPEDEDADPVGRAGLAPAKTSATPNPLESELVGRE